MGAEIAFSVFTKPWRTETIDELGAMVREFGFDGIEFPLREGYQVEPRNADQGLPELVAGLAEYGVKVFSVASSTDERIFSACAEAGIPLIRVMADIDVRQGYLVSESRFKRQLEQLAPLCQRYGIRVGIQQHHGDCIVDSMGLRHLLESFDPRLIGAVWDAAHDALAGQQPEFGLDIVWEHLCMVNLKNAFYMRTNGPEADHAEWKRHFTTGAQGLASWPRIVHYLRQRNYSGVICLTAQYEEQHKADRFVVSDLQYAKRLWNGGER